MLNPAYLTMQQSYPSIWINGFGKKKKKSWHPWNSRISSIELIIYKPIRYKIVISKWKIQKNSKKSKKKPKKNFENHFPNIDLY